MRVHRLSPAVLGSALIFLFAAIEGPRVWVAWLLYRGDFARLEAQGPREYFVPAARAFTRRHRSGLPRDPMMAWANRQLGAVIGDFEVHDLKLHSSGRLLAALRPRRETRDRYPDGKWARLIAVDPAEPCTIIADTGRFEFGNESGLELDLVDIDHDGCEEVLISMFGTGTTSRLFRLSRGSFEQVRTDGYEGDFSSWTGISFENRSPRDPLVARGQRRACFPCPCGKEPQADVVSWKMEGGRYLRWTIRSEECGPACERPWTN